MKNQYLKIITRLACAALLLAGVLLSDPMAQVAFADPMILYVKAGVSGGDCTSWAQACADLQTALSQANSGQEIWVAAGTYRPSNGTDRSATFQLKSGVALYGGFTGVETGREQRDWQANATILSGDLLGNDNSNLGTYEPTRIDNSYHVVTGSGTDSSAVMDGFTISGGNAVRDYHVPGSESGGGMLNSGGSPSLNNLRFFGNVAEVFGGGMANIQNSSPTLTDVIFENNATNIPTAGGGGGLYNAGGSPVLTRVTFRGNKAAQDGGGLLDSGNTVITDATFIENKALGHSTTSPGYGGGIVHWGGNLLTLNRVTFSGNSSGSFGGGLTGYNLVLTDVQFIGNTAPLSGGGLYGYLDASHEWGNFILTSVIFKGNRAGWEGGGLSNVWGSLTNVVFDANAASSNGGGISNNSFGYADLILNPTLTNVTFKNNSAGENGGGMYADSSTLSNVTFNDNIAAERGGAIYYTTNLTLTNSILCGDSVYTNGQWIPNEIEGPGNQTLQSSLIQSWPNDEGQQVWGDRNPLLGELGDYGGDLPTIPLLPGSAAIDSGLAANCPAADTRGISRPQGGGCDMGAFESRGFVLSKPPSYDYVQYINRRFSDPLEVNVASLYGEPVDRGEVTFSAPNAGASATFAPKTKVPVLSGTARLWVTANYIAGSYTVTASAAGSPDTITYQLTNLGENIYLPVIFNKP